MDKLDAFSCAIMESGFPHGGVNVSIRLIDAADYIKQITDIGIKIHSAFGTIYTGHIDNVDQLNELVKLPFVASVGFSKPVYESKFAC